MEKQNPTNLDDFTNDLTGEMLSDVADRFFGERVEIDHMQETLDRYIQLLQQDAEKLLEKLAVLDILLLHETGRQSFFDEIGIDRSAFSCPDQPRSAILPTIPKAWTQKQRYVRLALQAYDTFQTACETYQHGGSDIKHDPTDESQPAACVDMIFEMAELINKKIKHANNSMTSECTLQFVRSLDFQASEAENFTGVIPGRYASGITETLCYLPVDITHLPIVSYPVPPRIDRVKNRLIQFWSRFYAENKQAVQHLLQSMPAIPAKQGFKG
ncbi:MAG: hypothetical protein AB7S77_10250 [Desulfatirhabdiaceae bacterium]